MTGSRTFIAIRIGPLPPWSLEEGVAHIHAIESALEPHHALAYNNLGKCARGRRAERGGPRRGSGGRWSSSRLKPEVTS